MLTEDTGYFAVGIWHPKSEVNIGSLWRSASLYGAAFVFTVGRRYQRQASDTRVTPARVPLIHYTDVGDLIEHLPHGCPLTGIELDERAVPLSGFAHPRRGAYLLGAEDHGLSEAIRDRCHRLVRIESPGTDSMNVACAGSVLLHHRYCQLGGMRRELRS